MITDSGRPAPRQRPWTGIIGGALLAVAAVLLAAGVLPLDSAAEVADRTWSILLFVIAATLVAELAAAAGVFDAVADRLGRAAAGRVVVLWLLVVALAVVATVFLSLDTTAVLLTPVVVLLARGRGLDAMPFALTTIWLANTGSLLFPMSNLTNLLAAHTLGLDAWGFAALMAPAAVVGIVVPVLVIGVTYRRALRGRLAPAPSAPLQDPALTWIAGIIVAALLPALVSGLPMWLPACAATLALGVLIAVRRPTALSWSLMPWQIILLACGLFLVVETAHAHGLSAAVAPAPPAGAQHGARGPLGDVEGALEVDVDDGVEIGVGHAHQQRVLGDARVRDDHLDRAVRLLGLGERRVHGGGVGDITHDPERSLGGRSAGARGGHRVPLFQERLDDRRSDAAGSAGHQNAAWLLLHPHTVSCAVRGPG